MGVPISLCFGKTYTYLGLLVHERDFDKCLQSRGRVLTVGTVDLKQLFNYSCFGKSFVAYDI